MNNTKLGLSENAEAALSYVLGFVSGIIFLIAEKENQFIKFHALQSILFSVAVSVLNFILSIIFSMPFLKLFLIVGVAVCGIVGLASFAVYVFLIITAYTGRVIKIPLIGEIAWNLSIK